MNNLTGDQQRALEEVQEPSEYLGDFIHGWGVEGLVGEDGEMSEEAEKIVVQAFEILQASAFRTATAKGWYDTGRGFPEEVALMHSELSEALEEYRNDQPNHYYSFTTEGFKVKAKPEGQTVELADCIVRIADAAEGRKGNLGRALIEKMRCNRLRPARHGGKKA